MRVLVIVKANNKSEAGVMPSEEMLAAMGKFNEELINAGVMLAGEGLHPSSKGKRVRFSGGNRTVIDGPFAETRELIAGYWVWQVKSIDEAVEWLKKAPFDSDDPDFNNAEVEIRPLYELEDFGEEMTPELREQEENQRTRLEAQQKS
jgi:hypothetical protein